MQQVLPFVQVRDLPSAASFYSAITQPLKLRYISANASSVVFGDTTSPNPDPVLEIKKAGAGLRVKPSRVVLSASSPSVLAAFRAAALRADPEIPIEVYGGNRVEITDFDGNKVEVVCNSSSGQLTEYEGSISGTTVASRGPPSLRRSLTTSNVEASRREGSRGVSNGAEPGSGPGFGAVLGAAAFGVAVGGALTYALMSGDRQRPTRQEYNVQAGTYPRRASNPDPPPNIRSRYGEIENGSRKYPPSSYGARYAQLEAPARSRVLEDVDDRASRHSSQYTSDSRVRRRSEVGENRRPLMITEGERMSSAPSQYDTPSVYDTPPQRLLMDTEYRSQVGDDRRSHAPSKPSSRAPSRASSKAPSRAPSRASSKHADSPSKHRDDFDTRSRASTVRQPPPSIVDRAPPSRSQSQAPSRYSTAPSKSQKVGRSRATSYVSARDVDLPPSRVDWDGEDDDDMESVAPSDSISCVGDDTRHSRRSRTNSVAGGSLIGRYRKVVNEFDKKRRPLYGSEYDY